MFWCWNGEEEDFFFLIYEGGSIVHGRTTLGMGRAHLSGKCWSWEGLDRHSCATVGTGRANVSGHGTKIFFFFFASYLDKFLQNK